MTFWGGIRASEATLQTRTGNAKIWAGEGAQHQIMALTDDHSHKHNSGQEAQGQVKKADGVGKADQVGAGEEHEMLF